MIADGVGTLIGAILGCPFGTVVYIGHPVHKKVGAKTGYSLMNGCIYLILTLSGIFPIILSLIPGIAIGPIIFIFGLMICTECTEHIKPRHHCAIFFGLFFGIGDYIFTQFGAANNSSTNAFGVNCMSKGSALACMFWVSIVVYTTDRKWIHATIWILIAAAFAGCGLIHQDKAFSQFMDGFHFGGTMAATDLPDADLPRWNTSPFQFMIGYLSMAVLTITMWVLQKNCGKVKKEGEDGYDEDYGYEQPIVEEGVDGIFNTWWAPA
jgi:AGZA family xanthine/uracil permease-like MFS transporter